MRALIPFEEEEDGFSLLVQREEIHEWEDGSEQTFEFENPSQVGTASAEYHLSVARAGERLYSTGGTVTIRRDDRRLRGTFEATIAPAYAESEEGEVLSGYFDVPIFVDCLTHAQGRTWEPDYEMASEFCRQFRWLTNEEFD